MASRTHVVQDFSFGGGAMRPRRQIRYRRDEPVVLPRSSVWSTGGGLVAVVLAAGAIVVASAYAAYHSEPTALAPTPAPALQRDWQPLAANGRAEVTNLLSGPALAVPNGASSKRAQGAPERPAVVPNPTTPPDAIARPKAGTEASTPLLDPENPYR